MGERGFVEVQVSRGEFPAHHWSTMENSMEVSQKVKTRTIICTSNPTSGYISKGNENQNESQRDICTPMLIVALFTTPKLGKQSNCPSMDEWMKMM